MPTKKVKSPKAKAEKKTRPQPKTPRLSALTAAAQVLRKARRPMNCRELIDTMAAKRLWTSPQGKTPHATLHAAISREIGTKGAEARFRKAAADRGKFESVGAA